MKKKWNLGVMKRSKSTSDITQGILVLKDDFGCFQSKRLGTRSLSHDSIFPSEQCQSDPEPSRVLSQENVHGKIQALQLKLQMKRMHLGPPPLLLPIKQTEDHQHRTEVLKLSKNLTQKGILPHPISPTLPPFHSSATLPGVDFSTFPQFISCLDNSAARHRMSIKPRNQRASTKSRRMPPTDRSRFCSESMIILERPLPLQGDEMGVNKEMTSVFSYSSQIIRPGKGLMSPPIKSQCPASPLKLLLTADDDYHPHAMSECKAKETPAVITTAEVGTKQILKSAEEMGAKLPGSAGPTSHKRSRDHKESLHSSNFKGVEGRDVCTISSIYTSCPISSSTEQVQPKSDKEFNMVSTHIKRNALNRNRVQDIMQEHDLPLKQLSPLDYKFEGRNVHKICPLPLSSEEGCLQESTTQQRSLSFSVSSIKNHERQRTGSFTGQIEQAGGDREHVFPLIKPLSNIKTQDPHRNAQVMASQTGATSTPAVSTKSRDLTISLRSAAQENGDSIANKSRDITWETHEGVEEANEELKMNKVSKEQRGERSVYDVKLQTTSQSKVSVKQHNPEVSSMSTPWLPESNTPTAVGQKDSKVGPVREPYTVPISPPLSNTEVYISAELPLFSRIRPHSARRDQERAGLITFSDFQASAQSQDSTNNITMSMPVCAMEKSPLQTSAKESRETSTELSWMTLAREKTKSLQQLFTNTLNDLAGLQTATRPTTSLLTQMSKPSAESIRPKYPTSSAQPSVSPLQIQQPTVHASLRATHPTPNPVSSISQTQSSIDQSEGVDFSLKHTLSQVSHVQQSHLTGRIGQLATHSDTKPVQLTGMYISPTPLAPQMIQQQLSQMSINQEEPIQHSLPQCVAKPQSSQSLRLSLSPKMIPHQPAHQALLPLLQPRPFGENVSSLPLGNVNQLPMPHSAESQTQYAGGLGSKALLIEQWHHQKPDAVKVVDQKYTPTSQTYASLDELLTFSSHKSTELPVSPGPIRLDREVRCQKKTLPPPSPSSSSHLQSNNDNRQPSWMELAKRKSMAWSDKTMD